MKNDTIVNDEQDSYDHNIAFIGDGTHTKYHLVVSNGMNYSGALGGTNTSEDTITRSFASGAIRSGVDSYKFDGRIQALFVSNDSTKIKLDGNGIDADDYPSHFITLTSDTNSSYKFHADALSGVSNANGSASKTDVVDGRIVEGRVWGGTDAYVYDGTINWFYVMDTIDVRIDGRSVDTNSSKYPIHAHSIDADVKENTSAISKLRKRLSSLGGNSNTGDANGSHTMANPNPSLGMVTRPFYSQHDIEMHVGRGREYESLQAAFNDLPHHIQHEVRIHVHGRTKDHNTAHIHSVSMANQPHFKVIGHDNAVINNGGTNVSIEGKMDHIKFTNLTFDFISQCMYARYENCTFHGNGFSAFSGKMGDKMLINCTIGDGSDKYGVASIGGENTELRDCTINAKKAGIHGLSTSVQVTTGNTKINAPKDCVGYGDSAWMSGKKLY